MHRRQLLLVLVLATLLGPAVPGAAAPAGLGPAPALAAGETGSLTAQRLRGFGPRTSRRPSFRRGPLVRSRRYAPRRRSTGFGRSMLRALGLAWLFSALFGWGPGGGSPFGLLLLLVGAWFVVRALRPRRRYAF